jgi:DNA segregation ATPase FtsK/SpoIIIE, S-DNA-T family
LKDIQPRLAQAHDGECLLFIAFSIRKFWLVVKGTCSVAKKKARAKSKKQVAKGQFIIYEAIGLMILTLSILGIADYGYVGGTVDYISVFLAGDWHFLLPIYWMYLAVLIMVRRAPVKWTLRQRGVLLALIITLSWSHMNFYNSDPSVKHDLFKATMDNIHALANSVRTIVDQNKNATPVDAGGGLIGFVCFSSMNFLFGKGTGVVLFAATLLSIIMITKRSLVVAIAKINRSIYRRIKSSLTRFKLSIARIRLQRGTQLSQAKKQSQASKTAVASPAIHDFRADLDDAYSDKEPQKKRKALAKLKQTLTPSAPSTGMPPNAVMEEQQTLLINDFADRLRFENQELTRTKGNVDPSSSSGTANTTEYQSDPANSRITVRWPERSQSATQRPINPEGITKPTGESVHNSVTFAVPTEEPYELPGIQLLSLPKGNRAGYDQKDLTANAQKLKQTLESFGVSVHVNGIHRGPTVTRYEIQPAIGVKVSRIVNLADDLALALAARDIRIEAPIPGKAAVGIEVPNKEVAVVSLREVLESSAFLQAESKLTIGLGRDISGEPIIGNLAKMPHLLVAGATGSGKSVCINGIITSLLFRAKPHEVKFIMIDPKMVELNVYNGIPHLMAPVVTDPRKAAYALKKVVAEMESRYELFAKKGTRDIERYNTIATEHGETPLPYIVVIIDELADLMMVAPGDVEDAICRIAQMARAAGIHLIVATQRPSVDVITGVIKANIPSRIAFAVSSQADSRTILDGGGAEKLLGRGDMLYVPAGASKPTRVQGAFLSDQEVEDVVQFVKQQQNPTYTVDLNLPQEEVQTTKDEVDELFYDAVRLVVESEQASVSMLQRRFKIGYARAARLVDQMEERGIVGPFEGSKPREVRLTKDQLQQMDHAG